MDHAFDPTTDKSTGCKLDHGFDLKTYTSAWYKWDHRFDFTTDTNTGCKWDHGFDPTTGVQGVNGTTVVTSLVPRPRFSQRQIDYTIIT